MVFFMAQSCSLTRNNNKTLYKPLPATAPPEHDHLLNESKKKSMSKICSNLFYIAAQFPGIACFQRKDRPSDGTSLNAPKPIRNQEDYFVFAFPQSLIYPVSYRNTTRESFAYSFICVCSAARMQTSFIFHYAQPRCLKCKCSKTKTTEKLETQLSGIIT